MTTSQATNSQPPPKSTPSSSSLFSSFTSSFASNKTAADLGKRFNILSQTLQQHARDLPKNISRLPDQLDSEHQQFVSSKTSDEKQLTQKHSEFVMPWEGYGNYEQELKQRILAITKDERNFIIPPPDDTTFEFDLKAYSQSARAILTQDKALSHMRFLLVPQQVNETNFWRNYFYRVITVKKAVLSETTVSENLTATMNQKNGKEQKKDDILFNFTADSDDGSDDDDDIYDDAKNSIENHQKMGEQVNQGTNKDQQPVSDTSKETTKMGHSSKLQDDDEMEEWERELRRAATEGL
ncbi:hypothetical protein BCR42DRAFT_408262 [Absidia repens]|uniref:BSD domain-containing protein n=1 Tax=Absidia repens TaxID=90262 RepID=A0A1X2IPN0_9FUNG|nr:hypothetical protein BCR42DRAFT_408262 [Absidia repens]